ncbi:MAG: three-Cys-motif partner protein TcmP [Thermoproteota archaeon]
MRNYEKFKSYLHRMHEEAVNILRGISNLNRHALLKLLEKSPSKEHYWTAKKLFCHAMYIPMFLLIGRKYFQKLIYIDTHSGPGVAKIGEGDDEVVVGSPLIAVVWPRIIASNISSFSKIHNGFDEVHFIERDLETLNILSHMVKATGINGRVTLHNGDCNIWLAKILKETYETSSSKTRTLFYVFIDPYGDLDSQVAYEALLPLTNVNADIMMSIMALNIARGLSSLRSEDRKNIAMKIFSKETLEELPSLLTERKISHEDIINAYQLTMRSLGYKKIEFIPIEFERGVLYYLMLAVKGGGEWISGFVDYIRNKAPRNYETLRQLFLQAVGKQKSVIDF